MKIVEWESTQMPNKITGILANSCDNIERKQKNFARNCEKSIAIDEYCLLHFIINLERITLIIVNLWRTEIG